MADFPTLKERIALTVQTLKFGLPRGFNGYVQDSYHDELYALVKWHEEPGYVPGHDYVLVCRYKGRDGRMKERPLDCVAPGSARAIAASMALIGSNRFRDKRLEFRTACIRTGCNNHRRTGRNLCYHCEMSERYDIRLASQQHIRRDYAYVQDLIEFRRVLKKLLEEKRNENKKHK